MHHQMPHGRQQSTSYRPPTIQNSRGGMNNAGGQQPNTRPPPTQTQPLMYTQPQYFFYRNPSPMVYPQAMHLPIFVQQPNGTTQHLTNTTQMSGNVSAGVGGNSGATQMVHQTNSHQAPLTTMAPFNAAPNQRQIPPSYLPMSGTHIRVETKRARNPLPIIDPNSGKEINVTSSALSNAHHSAALKIEAPTTSASNQSIPIQKQQQQQQQLPQQSQQQQQPQQQQQQQQLSTDSSDNNVTSHNNIGQDHSDVKCEQNYQIDGDSSNADEPPHTPVVSANADGPSVDITPKQSKNVKRKYVECICLFHRLQLILIRYLFLRLFSVIFFSKNDGHSSALPIEKPIEVSSTSQRKNQQQQQQSTTEATRTNQECDKNSKSIAANVESVKSTKISHESESTGKSYRFVALVFFFLFR